MESLFSLEGKRAVITGGSRGLGLQIAEAFARVGADLLITARKHDELDAAAKSLAKLGAKVEIVSCDLMDDQSHEEIANAVESALGGVDILVNNAGSSWAEPAESHSLKGWYKVMELNVSALFRLTQVLGQTHFLKQRSGKIINIASIGGIRGNRPDYKMHTIAYNTSKGAVVNFTRALAAEWGQYGVNVNCLCPGFFPSQMSSALLDQIGEKYVAATPLQRLGGDSDLFGPAIFLASDASRYITGETIAVDGGMIACG
ncbi:MAG: SDR family oxidoreductase [Pseudomonadota bacterium]